MYVGAEKQGGPLVCQAKSDLNLAVVRKKYVVLIGGLMK